MSSMRPRVFFGRLSFGVSKKELEKTIRASVPTSQLIEVRIIRKGSLAQQSHCCAFVTMGSTEAAQSIVDEMRGKIYPMLSPGQVKVEMAVPRMNDMVKFGHQEVASPPPAAQDRQEGSAFVDVAASSEGKPGEQDSANAAASACNQTSEYDEPTSPADQAEGEGEDGCNERKPSKRARRSSRKSDSRTRRGCFVAKNTTHQLRACLWFVTFESVYLFERSP